MAIAARKAQAMGEGPLAAGTGTVRTGTGSRLFAGAKITVGASLEQAS